MSVLFLYLSSYDQSKSCSLKFVILNTILSGTFLTQILIGSVYIANIMWILVFTQLFIYNSKSFNRNSIVSSLLLGIGLSSRSPFLIILLPIFNYLYYNSNLIIAMKQIAPVIIGFLLITIPFLAYECNNFIPIHYSNVCKFYGNMAPNSSIVFPIITLMISFAIS